MRGYRLAIAMLVMAVAGMSPAAWASPRSSYLCSDSPLDIYPDQRFTCEAMQSFKKGFDRHALDLFKQASRWGSKLAQYKVGLMYLGGYGVEADRIEGTAWLLLANERNRFRITEHLADTMRQLSSYEVGLARSRARELRAEYGDFQALERRSRWVRRLRRESTGSRLGRSMSSVRIVNSMGITGDQRMALIEDYETQLRDIVTTVEYRDFEVLEDDG